MFLTLVPANTDPDVPFSLGHPHPANPPPAAATPKWATSRQRSTKVETQHRSGHSQKPVEFIISRSIYTARPGVRKRTEFFPNSSELGHSNGVT
jgi:hypothetical protein